MRKGIEVFYLCMTNLLVYISYGTHQDKYKI